MFTFGQQDAPAKTAAASKNKSRRISLADRSSVHRNDENAAPASTTPTPRRQRGPNGKQHPLFQVGLFSYDVDQADAVAFGLALRTWARRVWGWVHAAHGAN